MEPERPDTDDLVQNAQGGDSGAYEALFARVQTRLLAYINLRTGRRLAERVEPMDVLQEAYMQAHRYFPNFDPRHGEGAFLRWMCTIVDNCLRDIAKHFGAKKRAPTGGIARISDVGEVRGAVTGPSSACARDEQHDRLILAMSELSDQEREVLLMRYFRDLPLKEIAAQVGIKERTVRTILGKARNKLGIALDQADTP